MDVPEPAHSTLPVTSRGRRAGRVMLGHRLRVREIRFSPKWSARPDTRVRAVVSHFETCHALLLFPSCLGSRLLPSPSESPARFASIWPVLAGRRPTFGQLITLHPLRP